MSVKQCLLNTWLAIWKEKVFCRDYIDNGTVICLLVLSLNQFGFPQPGKQSYKNEIRH